MRYSVKQRLIALVLLMAYTITGTALLPAVLTLGAAIDGSHAVIVSQSDHGTQLTLHHRHHEFTPAVRDHEHALARILVCFCSAAESGDHQFNSTQADTGNRDEGDALVRSLKQAPPVSASATFGFVRFASTPARDVIHRGDHNAVRILPQGLRQLLATVQLVI